MSTQAQLPDHQLLRLEELLDDPALPEAMRLDMCQGYLCAALSGPQPIPESQWLEELLGCPEETAGEVGREAATLLRLLARGLESELASGKPLLLLLYPVSDDDDAASDYVPWCEGYLQAVDTATEDWFGFLGASDELEDSDEIAYLDDQLFPFYLLTGDAEAAARAAGEDWPAGEELEELRNECEEKLPQAVSNIYRFWLAQRGTGTIRRQTPKVGRNDPCPCGSGRKYKRCCGAATS
ncbi:MAG: Protein translocase subunit SecA [Accumulibacter sp.]|jgi:uncharacterized protein|uniref:UPF0149 family protein n=1 Tax=Accumulibacter sp. TaxID=2053492 RepID=UPI001208C33E|nr:UPF0149 family protein [Accumulibacter sp.]QKS28460.1 MAG: UPF0149 family protein [Candidatus Accumulibacter similis]TLD43923.1 MAG: Protein translocase subunit SecA [Accumulibacter sp.]